jgi:hypothetical protein
VVLTEHPKPCQLRVDLGLSGDERGQRVRVRADDLSSCSSSNSSLIVGPMNASSGVISQRKIDPIVLFFELTSSATYGWPAS